MRGFRVGDRFNVQAVYQFANGRSTVIAGCALLPRRPEMTRCGKPWRPSPITIVMDAHAP
jgi:hypothetical protein